MPAPGSFKLLVSNLGMAATLTHLLLWNRDDLRAAWAWLAPSALRKYYENLTVDSLKFWKQGTPGAADG